MAAGENGAKVILVEKDAVLNGHGVAFALFPTSLDELRAVSDTGRLMPPKSTWFEPKLRSGLFIRKIREDAG